jgi:hypothetical protein
MKANNGASDTPSTQSLGGSLRIQPMTFLKSATMSQVARKWPSRQLISA